jgi:uncharacterized protein DUF5719
MSARGRLAVAVLLAAAVVAGGVLLERRVGLGRPAPSHVRGDVSGAWFCPHGGGEGWHAWVVVANRGQAPADVLVTSWVGTGAPEVARSSVAPRSAAYVEVPASALASASVVEFFGTPVSAGMVTARPDAEGGVAAEPCTDRSASRWFVPEASTLRGQEAALIVHNPFATEAVVDISLLTDQGPVRHGRLNGVVLAPGQVKAVAIGEFALGEAGVAAAVTAPLGRVAVAGVTSSPGGVRSVIGTPAAAGRWVLPGTGDLATGRLVVAGIGGESAFRADAQGSTAERPLVDLESVGQDAAATFDVPANDGGLLVEGEGRYPLVAGRMLAPPAPPTPKEPSGRRPAGQQGGSGPGGGKKEEPSEPPAPTPTDLAATGGAPAAAARWVVLPATAPEGGPAALLLQNPGGAHARVRVTLLGTAGVEGQPQTVEVAPGTTARVDLPTTPTAALVEATGGGVVPAQVALASRAYAVAVGVTLGAVGRSTG